MAGVVKKEGVGQEYTDRTETCGLRAPVAQLDRVSASEAEGHRFESCRVRHLPLLDKTFTSP